MDLEVYMIAWILQLIVFFDRFDGISARCKLSLFETPSMPFCEAGEVSRGPGQFIYMDTSGAPDFTKVECTCDLTFSAFGYVAVSYRVENETTSECHVNFKTVDTDIVNWGCKPMTVKFIVTPETYQVMYTKSSSSISDWDACIGILPESSTGVTVKCYPYRLISQASSTTTVLISTNQSTTRSPVGPIVGGVTGGIVLVALIVAVAIFVTLKRKTREKLPGQRTHTDFAATLGTSDNNNQNVFGSNDIRNRGIDIFLPTRAQQTTQFQEDIDPYDYIDDKHVRIAKIEPTVRKPSVSSEHTVQKPAVPPQEDDGGYLQPVDIPKVQYSDQEKIGHEENQYIVLQTAEAPTDTAANDYLHAV